MQKLTRDVKRFRRVNLLRPTSGKRLNKGIWRRGGAAGPRWDGTRMAFSENDHARFALVGAGSRASMYTRALGRRPAAIAPPTRVRAATPKARHETPLAGYDA